MEQLNASDPTPLFEIQSEARLGGVSGIAVSEDQRYLAVGFETKQVRLFGLGTCGEKLEIVPFEKELMPPTVASESIAVQREARPVQSSPEEEDLETLPEDNFSDVSPEDSVVFMWEAPVEKTVIDLTMEEDDDGDAIFGPRGNTWGEIYRNRDMSKL